MRLALLLAFGLSLLFAGLLAVQLLQPGVEEIDAADATGVQVATRARTPATAPAAAAAPVLHGDDWVETILARPLFSRDRRPAGAAATVATGERGATLPRLTGIAISPQLRRAIFAGADGAKSIVVEEGGSIAGFTVQTIAPGSVHRAGPERRAHRGACVRPDPAHAAGRGSGPVAEPASAAGLPVAIPATRAVSAERVRQWPAAAADRSDGAGADAPPVPSAARRSRPSPARRSWRFRVPARSPDSTCGVPDDATSAYPASARDPPRARCPAAVCRAAGQLRHSHAEARHRDRARAAAAAVWKCRGVPRASTRIWAA